MRKILFLDFDGVMHAENDAEGNFSKLRHLEPHLVQMDDIDIVISSSWRESRSLEELRQLFPMHLRDRIVGTTPVLECGFDPGGRQKEIEEFLTAANLGYKNAAWVALDDMADFFDEGCPYLILVDSAQGFGEIEGRKLREWYKSATLDC